jgi:hypothetical protein
MVFPLEEQKTWNGNVVNNKGGDEYRLENIGKPYQVPKYSFDKTITIVQQADSSLVGLDQRKEVYARNIGLVYREQIQVQLCSSTQDCLGKGKIDFGVKFYHRLNSYGKN